MSSIQEFLASVRKFRSRIEESSYNDTRKITKLRQLFTILITRISDETKVQFTSLFARLSYLISTYHIPYKESYLLHSFRKSEGQQKDVQTELNTGHIAISILMSYCFKEEEDLSEVEEKYRLLNGGRDYKRHPFEREIKVHLKSIDKDKKRIEAQCVDEPFDIVIVAYDRPDRNEDYTELIEQVDQLDLLPLTTNLVDVEIDNNGVFYPSSFVFEPDYMYDVTSISECFGAFANHEAGYLLRKFLKKAASKSILIGNLSNFFLDQLVYRPEAKFSEFVQQIFIKDPLAIALLNDQEVREMLLMLETHFDHIKYVIVNSFPQLKISKESCQVEPSFYSAKYGIQGRLDLFSIRENNATIIELKSGSLFRPNSYGLSNNHYHQTLIYDLLIESVFGTQTKRNNFILYSKQRTNQLRYAPALKAEQREALKERNHLYLHDRILQSGEDFISYYQSYARKHAQHIKGFSRTDFEAFLKSFIALDKIERTYCNCLLKFTIRELFINKLGNEGSERSNGLASLWLQDLEIKKEQFNIINHLVITDNQANSDHPTLLLKSTKQTASLSNFRKGDLGVLYPFQERKDDVLRHQVFKVTILSLEEHHVKVRLRSRQDNSRIFDNFKYWHIEHDTLENGYYEMTRSIYEFAQADDSYRQLIMGRRPPNLYPVETVSCSHHLTNEQKEIFNEIIKSKEYYLLWGPPGTGKTSVMLREIAHHYIVHEQDRIIFLAYTNRAVDEICEALISLNPKPSFIRIGSRYSTHSKFHPYLMEEQIAGIKDRKALRAKLSKMKVYVGTIASVIGKVNLFNLIKFDLAVIDEASQILETSLIGLLSRVRKFILIGDHLQLPAVVQQDMSLAKIDDTGLKDLGYVNLSSSLFERMYNTALTHNWNHAIGQLTHQGRMHTEIMTFVNEYFYKDQLKNLIGISRLAATSYYKNDVRKMIRINYFPTDIDVESDSIKVNEHEATLVVQLCERILEKCRASNIVVADNTIGVITPYRAQISAIRRKMRRLKQKEAQKITIDTVERYQGGARDIILMSTCMNYSFQLDALISLSTEGVDRKLNVAITRAKEQFILIGNEAILSQNEVYRNLIAIAAKQYLV